MNPNDALIEILNVIRNTAKRLEEISDKMVQSISGTVQHDGFKITWSDKAKDKVKK